LRELQKFSKKDKFYIKTYLSIISRKFINQIIFMKKIYLIDGNSFIYRMFFALPEFSTSA
jgi:hypothetical protein